MLYSFDKLLDSYRYITLPPRVSSPPFPEGVFFYKIREKKEKVKKEDAPPLALFPQILYHDTIVNFVRVMVSEVEEILFYGKNPSFDAANPRKGQPGH